MREPILAVRILLISEEGIFYGLRSIRGENNYFCNRPRWGIPGGRVHQNETPTDAAILKAYRILGITIKHKDLSLFEERADPLFNIRWYFFICSHWEGEFDAVKLTNFEKIRWIKLHQLRELRSQKETTDSFLLEVVNSYLTLKPTLP